MTLSKKIPRKDKNASSSRHSSKNGTGQPKKLRRDRKSKVTSPQYRQQTTGNLHKRAVSSKEDDSFVSKENFNQVVVLEKSNPPSEYRSQIPSQRYEYGDFYSDRRMMNQGQGRIANNMSTER